MTTREERRLQLREALLASIAQNDQSYGFGLLREVSGFFAAFHLYTTLEELEQERLIESYMEPKPEDRPPRKLYRLTAKGRAMQEAKLRWEAK